MFGKEKHDADPSKTDSQRVAAGVYFVDVSRLCGTVGRSKPTTAVGAIFLLRITTGSGFLLFCSLPRKKNNFGCFGRGSFVKTKPPNQSTTAQRADSAFLVLLMVRPPRVADRRR
jgi:hypothetical protein